jgi:hypothetical protein
MQNQLVDQAAMSLNAYSDMYEQLYAQHGDKIHSEEFQVKNPDLINLSKLLTENLINLLLANHSLIQQLVYDNGTHVIYGDHKEILKVEDFIPYKQYDDLKPPTIENPNGLNLKVLVSRNPESENYYHDEDSIIVCCPLFYCFLAHEYRSYKPSSEGCDLSKACIKHITVVNKYTQGELYELNYRLLNGFLVGDLASA